MSASTAPRGDAAHEPAALRGLRAASAVSLREAVGYLVERYAAGADEEAEIRAVIEDVAAALDGAARVHGGGQ